MILYPSGTPLALPNSLHKSRLRTKVKITNCLLQVDDSSEGSLAIKDNDSLAARISVEIGADLAILMSDVEGIYNKVGFLSSS